MRNAIKNLAIILCLAIVFFGFISMSSAASCDVDNDGTKCLSKTSAQVCNDWDGTGGKWGWCSDSEVQSCMSSSNPSVCFANCIGKSVSLNLGIAANEFGASPSPPQALWSKAYGCTNANYYEVSCASNSIGITHSVCASGNCDGDQCANSQKLCEPVGQNQCLSDTTYKTCVDQGNGNTDWGQVQTCGANTKCTDGACKGGGSDQSIIIVVAVAAVGLIGYSVWRKRK